MMFCDRFTCSMSVRACEANQQLAINAINAINLKEKTWFNLTDQAISRILVCGDCPTSAINPSTVKCVFRDAVSDLADRITRFDEWGNDPEVSAAKKIERGRNYREKNRETIRAKGTARSVDARIQQLREKLKGGTNGQTKSEPN